MFVNWFSFAPVSTGVLHTINPRGISGICTTKKRFWTGAPPCTNSLPTVYHHILLGESFDMPANHANVSWFHQVECRRIQVARRCPCNPTDPGRQGTDGNSPHETAKNWQQIHISLWWEFTLLNWTDGIGPKNVKNHRPQKMGCWVGLCLEAPLTPHCLTQEIHHRGAAPCRIRGRVLSNLGAMQQQLSAFPRFRVLAWSKQAWD